MIARKVRGFPKILHDPKYIIHWKLKGKMEQQYTYYGNAARLLESEAAPAAVALCAREATISSSSGALGWKASGLRG